jgi:hypothetical protein
MTLGSIPSTGKKKKKERKKRKEKPHCVQNSKGSTIYGNE